MAYISNSQTFLVLGLLYTLKNYWGSQKAFVFVGYVYQNLLYKKIKPEFFKIKIEFVFINSFKNNNKPHYMLT